MKCMHGSSPTHRKMSLHSFLWVRIVTIAVTALALVFSQTAPAFAYGPGDAFAGHNDVRAMFNLRVPLGASRDGTGDSPSLGFTVQRQFRFHDPIYDPLPGSFANSAKFTVDAMDLRMGLDGRVNAFRLGGLDSLHLQQRLSAVDDGGTPRWVWVAVGGVVVLVVLAAVVGAEVKSRNDERCATRPDVIFC